MTVTTDKVCEVATADSQLQLAIALTNPLQTYGIEVRGIAKGVLHGLTLKVLGVVLVDKESPLADSQGDAYLIICHHLVRGACYIEVPWMTMSKGDLTGNRLVFCDTQHLDEHLALNWPNTE